MLLSKGVDIDRLNRKHSYVSSQAGQVRATHASKAGMDLTKYRPKASHLAAQDISLDDLTEICRRKSVDRSEMLEVWISRHQIVSAQHVSAAFWLPNHLKGNQFR